jgi:tRNA-Thr(GGU) m(6)t(6)A37 methyltransferase TsaA
MKRIQYEPIGMIRTPFKSVSGMPIQPVGAGKIGGTVVVAAKYRAGLKDLQGFSHIILLYHFHKSRGYQPRVIPFLDARPRGLFATRAPARPNPIGLSVVRLVGIKGRKLSVEGIDVLDGTPLLDIKPYVPEFDSPPSVRTGWFQKHRAKVRTRKADSRFTSKSRR